MALTIKKTGAKLGASLNVHQVDKPKVDKAREEAEAAFH